MDLSRIESLTREMLEAEARRRGIKSPEFRTRTELVRLILRHQYGGQLEASRERLEQGVKTVQIARELVGTAMTVALGALPARFDMLGLWSGKRTLPREHDEASARWTPPPARPAPPARPSARASTRPAAEPATVTAPTPDDEPRASFAPLSVTPQTGEAARRPSSLPPAEAAPAVAPAVAPASAPEKPSAPTTRTFQEEPIRTRSMAQLLAAQGHRERALAIYEELIAQDSTDRALEREAAALRRGEPAQTIALPEPPRAERPSQAPSGVWSSSKERLTCEGEPQSGLLLRWAITDEGERRARAVLGVSEDDGELTVRLVSIRPDADRIVRSEITEHGPVAASGEWAPGPLADAERCVAAIGMRAGDRFVSIVHVQPQPAASV